MAKRVNVTLDDDLHELLTKWAKYQRRSAASLATFLIEKGMKKAQEDGEIPANLDNQNDSK